MSVNERLMSIGEWSVSLIPETPQSIIDVLRKGPNNDGTGGFFGHVIITPVRVETSIGDAGMLATSRYTGIFRKISGGSGDATEIGGPGLAAWLGDEDGKGPIIAFEDNDRVAGTPSEWVDLIIPNPGPIAIGTVTDAGANPATLPNEFVLKTPRQALDYLSKMMGIEWRINPDATIDVGTKSVLWPSNNTSYVIVTPTTGGKEPQLTGLDPRGLTVEEDMEQYVTQIWAISKVNSAVGVDGTAAAVGVPYKDIFGNVIDIIQIIDSPDTIEDSIDIFAEKELARLNAIRQAVPLSTDTYDVGGIIQPGDVLLVWDPERNMIDMTTGPVQYRGQTTYPKELRVYAVTWPIQQGMGVYFRDRNGLYTELTQYVEFETEASISTPLAPSEQLTEGDVFDE